MRGLRQCALEPQRYSPSCLSLRRRPADPRTKGLGPSVNARVKDHGFRKPGSVMLLSLNDVTFHDHQEAQCFDFFRTCSVPTTNLFVTDNFWSRVILQAIPAEPSIKHGILALGAMHRHFATGQQSDRDYATDHYLKAMRHMANTISRNDSDKVDTNIVLMTMIVLHCFECHNQNFNAAGVHLKAGLRLLNESKRPPRRRTQPSKSSSVIDEITRTLHRLDVHDLTFSDQSSPYEWPETLYGADEDELPTQLTSVEQGRDILMALFKRAAHLTAAELARNMGKDPKTTPEQFARRRVEVAADLAKWRRLMEEHPEPATVYPTPFSGVLFQTYYSIAVMNLAVSATGTESTWDMYTEYCSHLVASLGTLFGSRHPDSSYLWNKHVSYDLGIIAPLFWIAVKCRHPLIRRESIAVLSSCNRREGKWSSIGAALVSQIVVDLEEKTPDPILTAADVPEANRVHLIEPRVNTQTRQIELHLWRRGDNGAWAAVVQSLQTV